ncbi:LysR family transcriptional regulator [Paenibacillus sp. KQZ6P-2]|uniref:LysR family transcriptional regulator n=1 Tax=Paenibacillus mangrovi TaxID=2931978 RepID=A0A9X1WVU4_9BACL|nr:LysR family transcriptional regulator [Paenibacillus mangrovi]MCJ8014830.1 LysR family transcriptional regulator [Paenibacillus mangrovi]
MDLAYFQTFREVAVRQSFTRAAEELGYAQSSVTAQIQKLEKVYGVQLFERYGKGMRLTSAGEELFSLAVQMLDLFQQSKEKLSRQGGGTLSIGTIDSLSSYYLPPYLQKIKQQYPELRVQLHPGSEEDIIKRVKDGSLDLGLILDHKPSDLSLTWLTLRKEPLILIARPGHPLEQHHEITLNHLIHAEWIMPEESCNYRIMLEKLLNRSGYPYRIGFELGNPEAVKRCVMSGFGISLLPEMAVMDEIRRGDLMKLPFSHPDIQLSLQMVIHPKKWLSIAVREFIEMIKEETISEAHITGIPGGNDTSE